MLLQHRLRKTLVPLLATFIAALSVWLFQDQPDKGPTVTTATQDASDSFMENFTTTVLDAQGHLQYQLQAEHMAHYADDDRSEFIKPQFTAFQADGQRWTALAETGRALGGTEQILLNGAVTIQRKTNASAAPSLEIHTRDVRIQPTDNYAETAQHTTIMHGQGERKATIKTVGLQIYFREGQMTLLSQVRGVYAP